jgi:hypothetical protein
MYRTTEQFWEQYNALTGEVRKAAEKSFKLLKENLSHPSLQFKKVGTFWSVRIDLAH